jgi:hypothetical protein
VRHADIRSVFDKPIVDNGSSIALRAVISRPESADNSFVCVAAWAAKCRRFQSKHVLRLGVLNRCEKQTRRLWHCPFTLGDMTLVENWQAFIRRRPPGRVLTFGQESLAAFSTDEGAAADVMMPPGSESKRALVATERMA